MGSDAALLSFVTWVHEHQNNSEREMLSSQPLDIVTSSCKASKSRMSYGEQVTACSSGTPDEPFILPPLGDGGGAF